MNRKWMIGIGVSLLVAASLILVGIGAYRAGERDDAQIQVVGEVLREGESTGRTIVVNGDGWDGHWGFFPGFFVFPLIVIGLVLLCASRRRRYYGHGYGYPAGPGCPPPDDLDEWHRRAHEDEPVQPPSPTG